MKILGLSCFYHDSAACLIDDGVIVSAAQEERFTRIKHDSNFPTQAIKYCLNANRLNLKDIDAIVFYEKPFTKFERIIDTYLTFAPRGLQSFSKAMPLWISDKLFQKKILSEHLQNISFDKKIQDKIKFSDHHLSHAASAYYPSPFEDAVVLTMDGVGEWATGSVGFGKDSHLELHKEMKFPHSLGLLYSAFTYFCGFKVNSGEYKLMGLAPYGTAKYVDRIKDNLLDIKSDGSFRLNMEYFDYCVGLKMTNDKFSQLFELSARTPEEPLTQNHMDLATSIQTVTEEIVIKMTRSLAKEFPTKNLCLAGGVALNCVANGKILKDRHFDNIWIQPAAGDAGGALGAALAYYYLTNSSPNIKKRPAQDQMAGSYLGPEFSEAEIISELSSLGANYNLRTEDQMITEVTTALVDGSAIGWFQGRMEFGPRALGNRSIIADPRNRQMQTTLNLKVKFRESFRPFAPSVLKENVSDWFEMDTISPYMLLVANIKENKKIALDPKSEGLFGIDKLKVPRSEIPAVTHVDYSARIQTVDKNTNSIYHRLIDSFHNKTGCPILVNTSFNVRGEPIVCTPTDAYRCFMGTDLDLLVIGNVILRKSDQPAELLKSYKDQFELD